MSLFREPWVYDFALLDEFSIAAFWCGQFRECFDGCVKLLKNPRLPLDYRSRIHQNALLAIEKLGKPTLANLLPGA